MIEAQARLNNRWAKIAECLPGRTDNSVKNRWKSKLRFTATIDSGTNPTNGSLTDSATMAKDAPDLIQQQELPAAHAGEKLPHSRPRTSLYFSEQDSGRPRHAAAVADPGEQQMLGKRAHAAESGVRGSDSEYLQQEQSSARVLLAESLQQEQSLLKRADRMTDCYPEPELDTQAKLHFEDEAIISFSSTRTDLFSSFVPDKVALTRGDCNLHGCQTYDCGDVDHTASSCLGQRNRKQHKKRKGANTCQHQRQSRHCEVCIAEADDSMPLGLEEL